MASHTTMISEGKTGRKEKRHQSKERLEVKEKAFLDCMKTVVVKQLNQMSDIAAIQDQVVRMIEAHEERRDWLNSKGLKHFTSPHFFVMCAETKAFLCLLLFLFLQLCIQLLFHGRLKHLAPYLPDSLQGLLK